jgi:hypothetical protein
MTSMQAVSRLRTAGHVTRETVQSGQAKVATARSYGIASWHELRALGSAALHLPGVLATRGCTTSRQVRHHDRLPVVLVHGYASTASVWGPLQGALTRAGFGHIVTVNYNSFSCDPAAVCDEVTRAIYRACSVAGASRAHVVGHSLRFARATGPGLVAGPDDGAHRGDDRDAAPRCAVVLDRTGSVPSGAPRRRARRRPDRRDTVPDAVDRLPGRDGSRRHGVLGPSRGSTPDRHQHLHPRERPYDHLPPPGTAAVTDRRTAPRGTFRPTFGIADQFLRAGRVSTNDPAPPPVAIQEKS